MAAEIESRVLALRGLRRHVRSRLGGEYVLEIIPRLTSAPTWGTHPLVAHQFELRVTLPSGRQELEDVQHLLNISPVPCQVCCSVIG